jgi:hypothetical protein
MMRLHHGRGRRREDVGIDNMEDVMNKRLGALIAGLLFVAATVGAAVIPGPCQFMPRNFPKLCKKAPPPPVPPCPVAPCKPPAPK